MGCIASCCDKSIYNEKYYFINPTKTDIVINVTFS